MMFVGDSLNRGMYVSLICLLHSRILEKSKSMDTFGSLTVFSLKVFWIQSMRLSSLAFIGSDLESLVESMEYKYSS